MLSIEYTQEPNYRATDITYGVVAIIKKTWNYGNDQSAVNAYYQALRELKEVKEADTASETASVVRSSKGTTTLDRTWYNIKNLWKGKKKVKEIEESKKCFHTLLPLSLTEDSFKEILLKPVFDPSKLKEELLEFRKKIDKGTSNKDLIQFLLKHL